MDPLTLSAIISGGMSLVGGMGAMGGSMSSSGDAQDFAEDMAKKKYRWAVKDMKAAGLNPALMFGSGGPTGGAGMPTMTFPNVLEGAAATAGEFASRKATIGKQGAEERLTKESRLLREQEFNTEVWREQQMRAQTELTGQLMDKAAADAEATRANAALTRAQIPGAEALGDLYSEYPMLRILQQFSPGAGALVEGLKLLDRTKGPSSKPRQTIHRHYRVPGRP